MIMIFSSLLTKYQDKKLQQRLMNSEIRHKSQRKSSKDLIKNARQYEKSQVRIQSVKKLPFILQPLSLEKRSHKTQPSQVIYEMQSGEKNNNLELIKSNIINSLKISPSKQYETRLQISADRWLVYDYRINNYKRGWKPYEVGDFSGLIRLLCAQVFIQLMKKNSDINKICLRINNICLKEQLQLANERKLSPSKKKGIIIKQAISRIFQNNMIINLSDMMYGLLMSNYDDIVEYSIILLGYLCYCHLSSALPIKCLYIEKISEANEYTKHFSIFTNQYLFPSLQMQSSIFKSQIYKFQSSSNDICRLQLSLDKNEIFQNLIKPTQIECKIKYQMGFNFWENRLLVFKNKRRYLGPDYEFVACWRSKQHFSVISKNKELKTLTILQDSRFGMLELDIKCIQKWVIDVRKPIAGKKNNLKQLPILKLSNGQTQLNNKKEITRSNTQGW